MKLQVGQKVTIAQLASVDKMKMYVFTGIIDSNVDPHRDCRSSVAVKVKDAKRLLRDCLREDYPITDPGLHRVLFYGDWVDEIEDLGQILGFQVVREME